MLQELKNEYENSFDSEYNPFHKDNEDAVRVSEAVKYLLIDNALKDKVEPKNEDETQEQILGHIEGTIKSFD